MWLHVGKGGDSRKGQGLQEEGQGDPGREGPAPPQPGGEKGSEQPLPRERPLKPTCSFLLAGSGPPGPPLSLPGSHGLLPPLPAHLFTPPPACCPSVHLSVLLARYSPQSLQACSLPSWSLNRFQLLLKQPSLTPAAPLPSPQAHACCGDTPSLQPPALSPRGFPGTVLWARGQAQGRAVSLLDLSADNPPTYRARQEADPQPPGLGSHPPPRAAPGPLLWPPRASVPTDLAELLQALGIWLSRWLMGGRGCGPHPEPSVATLLGSLPQEGELWLPQGCPPDSFVR